MAVSALFLTEEDVRAVLTIGDLLEPMEQALGAFSSRRVVQPVRSVVPVTAGPGLFAVMPGSFAQRHALGAKLVTVFGGNRDKGLPSHLAIVVLLDEHTGQLRAVMDGRYITEIRTAAVSAVAARQLAGADAGQLAILGSGVQARSHLRAVALVRPLTAVRVWSPNRAHREAFVAQMQPEAACTITACADPEQCVRDADLVVAATSSPTPVLRSSMVNDGAHVMAVGACRPDERELDPQLVRRGRLFVDSRDAALQEAGDILLGIREQVFGAEVIESEIGDVVGGRAPGRRDAADVTIFKSLGLAVEDLAAADLACSRASARGVGRMVDL